MLIRGAARLATGLKAELYALYVERPGASTRRTPAASAQLARNQRLAHDLGAQIVVARSHRVADSILAFAHQHAITVIVLGEPHAAWWQRLCRGDVVKRIKKHSDTFDVRVIADDGVML
jgi:two-component system sensor histidine kinase KdpD